MSALPLFALALAGTAIAAWLATAGVRWILVRYAVFDRPNQRSSHTVPTPRGGGVALLLVVCATWGLAVAWLGGVPPAFVAAMVGTALLAVISWLDDIKGGMPVASRLAVQAVAVALALATFQDAGLIFQGFLPPALDRLVAALSWLWFINLFNFMDGIDGISGVETVSLGVGLALVAWLAGFAVPQVVLPAFLAAAALGFLAWNWQPAKIFLGDVGSVPLGFLLGWLLLLTAAQGQWLAAAILPLYYLADATITLVSRLARGETVWRAHRGHFYQRAVRGGLSHARVATGVLVCNAVLVGLAVAATTGFSILAAVGAIIAVAVLLWKFGRLTRAD
jgi:UDP-N-acetylmuramyl pentapeptide phosphotransferase/UDP-N-acetylglucosamine-1-phosphate transferase